MRCLLQYFKHNKFLFFHYFIYIVGFYGIYRLFTDVSIWWFVAAFVWSKLIQLIGHSIGMHRYFSHNSFKTTKLGHWIISWTSLLVGVGSPLSYARNHRFHHRAVDTPNDIHSPVTDGKLKTFFGLWAFHDLNWFLAKGSVQVKDLIKDPLLRFIHQNYYKIWSILLLISFLIDWKLAVYMLVLPSLIYHIELNILINCISHSWGYRNYKTNDHSRNNIWVNWYNLGEGLHNNHHAKPWLYDFATRPGEWDINAWVIDTFFAIPDERTSLGKTKESLPKGHVISLGKEGND